MKKISTALKTHLAQPYQTMSTMWLVVRTDSTVLAFTDHDQDITFNLETALGTLSLHVPSQIVGTGSRTYKAAEGYTSTNIATSGALNVDNLELSGLLLSPSITEADLHAGLWDFAYIVIFQVNWADLTMGPLIERVGNLGQVSILRGSFKAEMRGLTQAYSRQIGELTSPACRADLGDARCKVNLSTFTVTGTVDGGASPDNGVFYCSTLTQAGPGGGIAITHVSNANPGVVTMATTPSPAFTEGEVVTLSGIVGPALLNVVTTVHSPSGVNFNLSVNTTDTSVYPVYVSGGTVTPFGAVSGYFDFGVVTWTGGLNSGLKMEVKSYVPGQVTLFLPMPYLISNGDTFSIHAGCDKLLPTCRDRFSNLVNMRAEPYLPGIDKMIQVGRHK